LAFQLLNNAKRLGCPRQRFVPEEVQQVPQTTVVSDLSDPSTVNSDKPVVWALQDVNGRTHYLVKFDTTKDPSGRSRTKKRKWKICLEQKKGKMSVFIASRAVRITVIATTLVVETALKATCRTLSVQQGALLNYMLTHLNCLFLF